jgi:hypothetical protein
MPAACGLYVDYCPQQTVDCYCGLLLADCGLRTADCHSLQQSEAACSLMPAAG